MIEKDDGKKFGNEINAQGTSGAGATNAGGSGHTIHANPANAHNHNSNNNAAAKDGGMKDMKEKTGASADSSGTQAGSAAKGGFSANSAGKASTATPASAPTSTSAPTSGKDRNVYELHDRERAADGGQNMAGGEGPGEAVEQLLSEVGHHIQGYVSTELKSLLGETERTIDGFFRNVRKSADQVLTLTEDKRLPSFLLVLMTGAAMGAFVTGKAARAQRQPGRVA